MHQPTMRHVTEEEEDTLDINMWRNASLVCGLTSLVVWINENS